MAEEGLEERVQKLEAVHEIQNVMGRYSYMHTAGMHRECIDLFTSKTPGSRVEMMWGVYEGTNAAKKCYAVDHVNMEGEGEARRGQLHMHTLTTPVIEVAGDGKTARAVWIAPGHESSIVDGKAQGSWAWCKYGCDFVKEDGRWKIWHLHVYGIFMAPYDKCWTEVEPDLAAMGPGQNPDKPPTTYWNYSPTATAEYVPAPPEPYETYDENNSY